MSRAYFLTDYTLTTDVTVSFTSATYGPLVSTIRAGTWFANAMTAWAYLVALHQGFTDDVYNLKFFDDPTHVSVGKIQLTVTAGTIDSFVLTGDTDATQTFWQWLGGSSTTFTFTAGVFLSGVLPGFFFPYWPLRSYAKGVQHMSGTGGVQRAFAGNVGSWGTVPRETVEVAVNIDRQAATELEAWYTLWRTRWRVGKTVSMYLWTEGLNGLSTGSDRLADDLYIPNLLDFENELFSWYASQTWIWRVTQCDQLQFAEDAPQHKPQRVVEYKSLVSYDGPYTFQRAAVGGGILRGYSKPWSIL